MRPADHTDPLYRAMLEDGIILESVEPVQTDPPEPYLLWRVVMGVGVGVFAAVVAAGVWTR